MSSFKPPFQGRPSTFTVYTDEKNAHADKPFPKLQYCVRCCVPQTQEGVVFDELGVCQACQSAEQKIHIDWAERERDLRATLEAAKAQAGNNYDCIIPISGGKDSTFQLHVLTKIYGMKPLAVTFSHNWYSETGWYNLQNSLEQFNVDHIMFTPNRSLVNRIAKHSLAGIGDSCWHCHAGVGAFPLQAAVRFNIPLLVWGESIAESSGRASYKNPVRKFDREYFTKVSAKLRPDQMVRDDLSERDLYPFNVPSAEECERVGVYGIHLGDYIFWDDERQTEFVRDVYGWRETQIEGSYKRYKSAECIMPGVHDYANYLKRGYGRATFHSSVDVRAGLLSRDEAWQLIRDNDGVRPEGLDYYLKITGMTEEEFHATMEGHRRPELKNVVIPIYPKSSPNEEKLVPHPQQLIEKVQAETAVPQAPADDKAGP
ncbi:N-acetyl sugar amidotransferase [Variovorax terrae]|uniref:N-acetyl sugar amidotransferase n=1 Tax=Variovorax terrae TaxID=2923278 RepID=A0A9X1VY35_9BURK|nr:N-acetyl sugar amidotransferase [Variovorax terrae]MCJ0764279.1 N-acetyl sugar amidotransferase [Variovorax terrae]